MISSGRDEAVQRVVDRDPAERDDEVRDAERQHEQHRPQPPQRARRCAARSQAAERPSTAHSTVQVARQPDVFNSSTATGRAKQQAARFARAGAERLDDDERERHERRTAPRPACR